MTRTGFYENGSSGGTGYTYDANGNLKTDTYKGITTITYNHLNLPTSIQWGVTKKIDIQYDAAGGQLSRTIYTGVTVDYKQDYIGGVEYRTVGATRKIESIFHAEGRRYNTNVNMGSSTEVWRLEYSIRDHLGNTRLTFADKDNNGKIDVTTTSTNEILSEQHYYPFGLSYEGNLWMNDAGDVDNRYLYNGKELTMDHGLGWYNYGARWYDPSVGRFTGVDPIADRFPYVTTYNYAENRVPNGIDLWGLQVVLVNELKDPLIYNAGIKEKDNSAIHIFAHGNQRGIRDKDGNWINTAKEFDQMLIRESEQWKNRREGEEITVVLHSCRTGRCIVDKNGDEKPSFAQEMSAAFDGITIIAPDERDYFSGDKKNPTNSEESGPYRAKYADSENGEYKRDENGNIKGKEKSDIRGNWNIFKGGKQTGQYSGGWTPIANPGIIDNLLHKKQR